MKALVTAILKDGIFGPCVTHIYSIEFQKRGLPHMHLLIFLKHEYKLLAPEIVDSIISAEWPDPDTHPQLFEVVKKFMVHGPCGALNPKLPCMRDGKCMYGYPKPFQERTNMNHDGYPQYSRRNDGRMYNVGGFWLDNCWIIPHNPFCMIWLNCHINVECAVCFGSMKYINKYIDKGGDCSTLSIWHNTQDEVKQYIDGRYFGASEAVWRILQFRLHEQHPNVVRLQIHLPHEQRIVFDPSCNACQIIEYAENADTALTAFFKANCMNGDAGDIARRLTYQDFPQHFTLKADESNPQSKKWSLCCRKGFALGRMTYVTPTAGERFYLRTLLMVAKGPKSFKDLKTIDGIICETFHEACLKHGLLEDDSEWRICLHDAAEIQTGAQLCHLFTMLLLFCTPSEPNRLWLEFHQQICDDVEHKLRELGRTSTSAEGIFDFGLYLVDEILHDSGYTLSDFPTMPRPSQNWTSITHNQLIAQQMNYDPQSESMLAHVQIDSLNCDQRSAFNRIWQLVLGSPVSRLQKNRDRTRPRLPRTGNSQDHQRLQPRSGLRSLRILEISRLRKDRSNRSQPVFAV